MLNIDIFFFLTAPAWVTWTTWAECTVSCGGGLRTRTRNCADGTGTEAADSMCAGQSSENENCSEWKCPGMSSGCFVFHSE